MTRQALDVLESTVGDQDLDDYLNGELKDYGLAGVFVGDFQNQSLLSPQYEFESKPSDPSEGQFISSACWRGYVSHYKLISSGELVLRAYKHLSGYEQQVEEVVSGDFWITLVNTYDSIVCIPFKGGLINTDRSSWVIEVNDFEKSLSTSIVRNAFFPLQDGQIEKIQEELAKREIEHLVHFTRSENLSSILENGLVGRRSLEQAEVEFISNDEFRFDYQKDATSLSVSFPNYKLFYTFVKRDEAVDWVVLRLKPSILWEKPCYFCKRNAAESAIASLPEEQKTGVKGFKALFEDQDGFPDRKTTGIPDRYATHPQAEVLVLDNIEPHYITGILLNTDKGFNNKEIIEIALKKYGKDFTFYKAPVYFRPRMDYEHWVR